MSSILIGGTDAAVSAAQAAAFSSSSKYRAYVAAVDKALKAFENPNEWADLISALGKLNRVLQSNAKFGDIPKPVAVAKRLSQCLHPALPHGVHLRALETYRQIFDILGPKDLSRLLYLFSVGLFPLMDYCLIKVKSELLNIFDQYLLPLGLDLKPALPGFITSLLLGLEEGTEFFNRSFSLLDRVQESVGAESFFACLWEAVLGSPSVRLPALIYVNAKFDRIKPMGEQLHIMGNDVNHMIAALCAAAEDDGTALVQRSLLDFLSAAFPLNSDHLAREDFVQLLRRCIFVILRRDMSLNRRLYQWLLNRAGDPSIGALPLGGADEHLDTSFFKTYALPLIRDAVEHFIKMDTVEVASGSASWDGSKELQLQFTEVRVCRLLLYFLDRPELGMLILEEALPLLLMYSAQHDHHLNLLLEGMDSVGTSSSHSFYQLHSMTIAGRRTNFVRQSSTSTQYANSVGEKRIDNTADATKKRSYEFGKTLNLLLNSLDPSFIWNFLGKRFEILLHTDEDLVSSKIDPCSITNESLLLNDVAMRRRTEELQKFPLMVLFCLKVVELDSHCDIREIHLPTLLMSILSNIAIKDVANIDLKLLVLLLSVARTILTEINHSIFNFDGPIRKVPYGSETVAVDSLNGESSTHFGNEANLADMIQGQWRVENCIEKGQNLLTQICDWYCKERSLVRLHAFYVISALQMDFVDFPIYRLPDLHKNAIKRSSLSFIRFPEWLSALIRIIFDDVNIESFGASESPTSSSVDGLFEISLWDFYARAISIDLIAYIYVRSASLAEQQAAIRDQKNLYEHNTGASRQHCAKLTTTVLLKSIFSDSEMDSIDRKAVFQKASLFAWDSLDEYCDGRFHETSAKLLVLLHSRRANEASSEVEDLIMNHLTSQNKAVSGSAARKFRSLWMISRSYLSDEAYPGLTLKPFNRVVMFLLGVVADDNVGYEKAELKNIATSWFTDCVKHGDLPKMLQMFALMLLSPRTSRVSIQYITVHDRLNRDQVATMPSGICIINLLTEAGRHSLYHLCEDVSVQNGANRSVNLLSFQQLLFENESSNPPPWYSDLKNRLLQHGGMNESMDVTESASHSKTHKRTVSDIPMFDEDNDSLSGDSIDSVDQEIIDVLQFIVDKISDDQSDQADFVMTKSSTLLNGCKPYTNDEESNDNEFPTFGQVEDSLKSKALNESESESNAKTTESSVTVVAESMKRNRMGHRRQDSLQESIFSMSAQELKLFDASELPHMNAMGDQKQPLCHELHAHMLLYAGSGCEIDLGRVEKILRVLIALIKMQRGFVMSRLIISCMVSSGTASLPKASSGSLQLIDLLSRHIRSILGQEFWILNESDRVNGSDTTKNKHYTFLELFLTISLYFLRSFYVNSPIAAVTDTDLRIAWKCKIAALDFLCELVRELIQMIRDYQSRALVAYVHGILQRSKLQKCLLHSLLTSVHNIRSASDDVLPLSVSILEFNEGPSKYSDQFTELLSGYQSSLLDLTALVIQLELHIKNGFLEFTDQVTGGLFTDKLSINHQIYNSPQHRSTLREPHVGMVELRMFLLTVLNALKKFPSRHEQWQTFLVQILPFLDRSLPTFCIHIIEQLCKNIQTATKVAFSPSSDKQSFDSEANFVLSQADPDDSKLNYPPNYVISALEALTTFMHYCVIDNSAHPQNASPVSNPVQTQNAISTLSSSMLNAIPGTKGATELFSNLVKVFTFGDNASTAESASLAKYSERSGGNSLKMARSEMLNAFPHILAILCEVWSLTKSNETGPCLPVGNPVHIRRLIVDLLSPIAQYHQQSFITGLSLVWRSVTYSSHSEPDQAVFEYSRSQLDVADLLSSIKVLPFENFISAIAETLKDSPSKSTKNAPVSDKLCLFQSEASLLEILHACVRASSATSLQSSWQPLQTLFTEIQVTILPPKAIFMLFIILADFVRIVGSSSIIEDKQLSRAVQDACQKLTEAITVIIGWQLEQTTWLKRTLVVKHDANPKSQETSPVLECVTAPSSLAASETNSLRGSTISLTPSRITSFDTSTQISVSSQNSTMPTLSERKSASNLRSSIKDSSASKRDPAHSTQALFLLAVNLAELIDSICKSEDKDRLLPILHSVWANTLPYLRAKNARNARFFFASSRLLASMSTFNYMRPVWRKSTLDLLLDPAFFKMDIQSLKQWLIVIDHLMTHDRVSFKELLARISMMPNSALSSLITSKEAEHDMRAQSLKRLAFIVLSSGIDQYQTQLPDIQERLTDNLRLSQVPIVHSQVFLCYRVLMIRLKPKHLVSMWPSMVTELIHVLLQIEQQLSGMANMSDDLKCDRNDHWMQLYLSACKLLEALCTLPSGYIPQFQMSHWAFVTSVAASSNDSTIFAGRISQLLKNKYGDLTANERKFMSASLIDIKTLTSFSELRPFFISLATQNKSLPAANQMLSERDELRDASFMNGSLSYKSAISRLEHSLYKDFAEHWQL